MANCTSDRSSLPVTLMWYIDEEKVGQLTISYMNCVVYVPYPLTRDCVRTYQIYRIYVVYKENGKQILNRYKVNEEFV